MNKNDNNFLFHNLPAIRDEKNNIIVFSPYSGEIAVFNEGKMKKENLDKLRHSGFFGKPDLSRGTSNICLGLVLTKQCNLSCKYCYANGGENISNGEMSLEMAITAIEAFIKEKKHAETIEIHFFGGEPTLKMDIIKGVVEWLKSNSKLKRLFRISTNGLLNNSDLNYLIKEEFHLSVSYDGLADVQNHLRPLRNGKTSAAIVEQTIKNLVKSGKKFNVHPTITSFNIEVLDKIIEHLAELGVKYVHLEKIRTSTGRGKLCNYLDLDAKKYTDWFSLALTAAFKHKIYLFTSPLMSLFSPTNFYCSLCAGKQFVVLPNGDISVCFVEPEKFKVGKIIFKEKKVLFTKRINKFLAIGNNNKMSKSCETCFAKFVCAGGCPLDNLTATRSIYKPDPENCVINKEILTQAISSLKEFSFPVVSGILHL